MKTKFFLLFASIIYFNVTAQYNWVPHLVTSDAIDPYSVAAFDLDNDEIVDLVSCDRNGAKITWYKNLGGGDFGDPTNNQKVLSENAVGAFEVFISDINGDGDMDVLFCAIEDNLVAWLENLGGGNFGDPLDNQQLITDPANVNGARSVIAANLDNDGDMDVISASWADNKVAWYENLGGGNFGDPLNNQQLITDPANTISAQTVFAKDIDGDGNIDVLSASAQDDKIAWYKNLGGGDFGNPLTNQNIISDNAVEAYDVYADDVDGDGNMDVLSASWADGKIAWYQNINGDGSQWIEHIISTNFPAADGVLTAQLNDGGLDVIASTWFNVVSWFENLGDGDFGDPNTNENIITEDQERPRQVITVDFDEDGDEDVVVVSRLDNKIIWYENDFILSINDNNLIDFSVYPSPTTGLLNVRSETTIVQIDIYNLLGQVVASNTNKYTIDISGISQGVYFIKVKDDFGNNGTKKIVKE